MKLYQILTNTATDILILDVSKIESIKSGLDMEGNPMETCTVVISGKPHTVMIESLMAALNHSESPVNLIQAPKDSTDE